MTFHGRLLSPVRLCPQQRTFDRRFVLPAPLQMQRPLQILPPWRLRTHVMPVTFRALTKRELLKRDLPLLKVMPSMLLS
jgi:hypothetical protein